MKSITDNRQVVLEYHEAIFSNKDVDNGGITLLDKDIINSDDQGVAETFFSNAIASLNIDIPNNVIKDADGINDPIDKIILKYSNHPSIISINTNVTNGSFSFAEVDSNSIKKE